MLAQTVILELAKNDQVQVKSSHLEIIYMAGRDSNPWL
jgi:hypothetical protein